MSVSQPGSNTSTLQHTLPLHIDENFQGEDGPLTGKAPKISTLADILEAARSLEDLEAASPHNRAHVEESCWRDFTSLLGRGFNYCCERIAALFAYIFGSAEPAPESVEQRIELPVLPENEHAGSLDSGPLSPVIERPAMNDAEVAAVRHFVAKWTRFSVRLPIEITKENDPIFEEWANDLCTLPLAARKVWEKVFIPEHLNTIRKLTGDSIHRIYGLRVCERTTSDAIRLCAGVHVADKRIMTALEKILPPEK